MKKIDFYNTDLKLEFIEQYSSVNKKARSDAQRILWKAKPIEEKYDMDLYELNTEQIYEILSESSVFVDSAIWIFAKVYKAYMEFMTRRPMTISNTQYKKYLVEKCRIDYPLSIEELFNICLRTNRLFTIRDLHGDVQPCVFDSTVVYYLLSYLGITPEEMSLITIKEIEDGSFFEKYPLLNKDMQRFIMQLAETTECGMKMMTKWETETIVQRFYADTPYLFRVSYLEKTYNELIRDNKFKTDKNYMIDNVKTNVTEFVNVYHTLYSDNRLDKNNLAYAKKFSELYEQDVANKDYDVWLKVDIQIAIIEEIKKKFNLSLSNTTLRDIFQRYNIYKGQRLKSDGLPLVYKNE